MEDSPLSITGSIVGIVALLISVIAICQALNNWASAYHSAPLELKRFTSSISNTIDERSFRLRPSHVPGPVGLSLAPNLEREKHQKGQWNAMLQEYFDAHLELEEELAEIRAREKGLGKWVSWTRLLWVFRRSDLEESVRRVETLRMRKMAVSLNALMSDMETIKDTLQRIEARIPEGTLNLPPPKPPKISRSGTDLRSGFDHTDVRPLRLYPRSLFGESVDDVVRTSLDSR